MPRFPLLPVCAFLPSLPTSHPARSTLSLLDVISILRRRENPFTTTTTTTYKLYPAQN